MSVKLKNSLNKDKNSSKQSFIIGMGTIFNLGGRYYPHQIDYNIDDNRQADMNAISSDWTKIGNDLKNVIKFLKSNE